jgi:uncharacterized protein (DUF58 family)
LLRSLLHSRKRKHPPGERVAFVLRPSSFFRHSHFFIRHLRNMRWFLGAIAVLLVAIALDLGLLAYAMYALLGVIVTSRFLADNWSAHLAATRELNRDEVQLGETVAVVVVLSNRRRIPIPWLLVEDLLPRSALIHRPPQLRVAGRRLQLISFRGKARKTILYQLQCNRRGYYQVGPLIAETGDVFGLYRRYRVLSEPSFLLAYPEVVPLEGFDIASRRPVGEVRLAHRLYEDPTRIAGVRAYEAGDPLNRVHWRTTARTGKLHSKIYEPSTVAGATLLLDFHEEAFDPRHEPLRSELAITAAASLAGAIVQSGAQVGLVTNGRDAADRVRREGWRRDSATSRKEAQAAGMQDRSERLRPLIVPTRRSDTQLRQILQTLARVEKTDGLRFAELVREATSQIPTSATVIAILTKVTAEAAIALGTLRRRGLAVTAIINTFEPLDFAEITAPLVAERIPTRHLRDRETLPALCASCVRR